jgi:hypothetical protein
MVAPFVCSALAHQAQRLKLLRKRVQSSRTVHIAGDQRVVNGA